MLTTTPAIAIAACAIRDITEPAPIPRGAKVQVLDHDPHGGDEGLYVVEFEGRVYLAEPGELRL